MSEPNWIITSVISAFIGVLLPFVVKIFVFLLYRFQNNRIKGEWHVYEITRCLGKLRYTKGMCTIKNGVLNRYSVIMSNDSLLYKGTADVEDNHLTLKLTNCTDRNVRVETCWQRYDFNYNEYDYMCGLWLANNYDGATCCGISILSLKELSSQEVQSIIDKNYITFSQSLICIERR